MIFRSSYQRLFSAAAGLALTGSLAAMAAVSPSSISVVSRVTGSNPSASATARSMGPVSLTANGRFVAFTSFAEDFFQLDRNGFSDIYVRDQAGNFTSIVTLGNPSGGSSSTVNNRVIANGDSRNPSISPNDGRFVAFESDATNLDIGDTNGATDVYLRDRYGDVIRVSVSSFGAQGPNDQDSFAPSVSDASFDNVSGESRVRVAYHSNANNLDGTETPDNTASDVFVTEVGPGFLFGSLRVRETRRISVDPNGAPGDGASRNASISADGRWVVFESQASNLVAGDTNGVSDIFLADVQSGTIRIISAERDDQDQVLTESDGDSVLPFISPNGRFIVYVSESTIFDANDQNGEADVFIHDRVLGTTDRVSVATGGTDGTGASVLRDANGDPSLASRPSVSNDGQLVVFYSEAEDLDTDGNDLSDVFIHDRGDGETRRLSVGSSVETGASLGGAISADGSTVAFESSADNMVFDDNNGVSDIFALSTGGGGGGGGEGAPVADAGADLLAFELETVQLDGSGSSDPENDPLTYQWTQVEGPEVNLIGANTATPSFEAPLVDFATDLVFELVVSDGVNESEPATVAVFVDVAPEATVSGTITDGSGQAIVGATVQIVRSDGMEADEVQTDGAGNYVVENVRVGENVITVRAAGLEPLISDPIDVGPGEFRDEDFSLETVSGAILGQVRRANGAEVTSGTVTLIDSSGEVLAESEIDGAGEYRLDDLDRFELAAAGMIVVEADGLITWTDTSFSRNPSQINRRNFQYGNLEVTVDARPSNQRKRLKGTIISVQQGTEELAGATIANANRRKVVFRDLPAVNLRVGASKSGLGSAAANLTLAPGKTTRRTLTIVRGAPF